MTAIQQTDFLVVGAGPIGSALALSLSSISPELSVVLIDQNPSLELESVSVDEKSPTFDTKVFAINSGSKQLLQDIGAWTGIASQRLCPYQRMHVWDSEGTGSVSFNSDELAEDSPPSELGFIIEANIIQQALNQKIALTSNVQVIRPAQIASIDWQDEESDKTLVCLDSGQKIAASIICAADGARSALRQTAGIETTEEDCQQHALVANIQLSKPHENCAWQIFRPTGPLAFLPLQSENQRHCSIVWSMDTEEARRVEQLDDSKFLYELERAVEGRFGVLQLNSKRISFALSQRHALDYGVPGLVLVGDAAHSIHPLAGLGANLGFQDVVTLSRELKRAHDRGIAFGDQAVINRYQRQRRLDNELTLKAMKFFKTTFADQGMVLNAARNLGLKLFSDIAPLKRYIAKQALMSRY